MSLTLLGRVPYAQAGFGERLVADWVSDFARVEPFFRRDPRREDACLALWRELKRATYPRAELAARLAGPGAPEGLAPEAREDARALARPETLAVITGQQAGLFGGPLYTLFKALTTVKLAREWTARFGPEFRFVPVFWAATDDHDLGEIDHAYFVGKDGRVERLRAAWGEEARGAAASEASFAKQVEALREPLEALLPGAAEMLLEPYRGSSVGAAGAALLARWLSPLGLIVADAAALRPFGRALYARELDEFPRTGALIRSAGAALRAAGYEPALDEAGEGPHVFLHREGLRAALTAVDGGRAFRERSPAFAARGMEPRTYAKDELRRRIEAAPETFSASAALRPVVQQTLFPVAAAVLGPGEMAYWAQLAPLHDHYGAAWPVVIPRASATLLDPLALRAVRKLNVPVADLFLPAEELKAKYLAGGALGAQLDEDRAAILGRLDALHRRVRETDRGLDPLFASARERIGHELDRIAAKTKASAAQREGPGAARLEYLAAFVRPKGRPQERTLSLAQFLAPDPGLAARLLEALEPLAFEHLVIGMVGES